MILAVPIAAPAISSAPPSASGTVTLAIDAAADRHPISPLIYGMAYASSNALRELNAPVNRQGGNPTSRYNWQLNADNRASDYFFASLPCGDATPGGHADRFIEETRSGGAEPGLTIPMLDWVAKLGPGRERTWSYSVAKYGAQQGNDGANGWPDMGNGLRPDGATAVTNDPNDASVPAGPAFQQRWFDHLTNRWGLAGRGGVRYYHLDNEPGLWHTTHRDVHPVGATMDEVRDKMVAYARRIKATDPGVVVMGPEEWHFFGAIFSGADMQYDRAHGFSGVYPDRLAHGGSDVYPFLLREMRRASDSGAVRLLDVCTIHYYPQGGEFGDDVTLAMQQRRNRSTRSLWDTNYVEESWLADNPLTRTVALIPRLRGWIARNYPGTRLGITEYNWGAERHMNGATAQADVLGIFGREGLELAERWTTPPAGSPVFRACQLYRNYDGACSTFGDTSVRAVAPDPDAVSVFASVRSRDRALTVMAINKQPDRAVRAAVVLSNVVHAGTAQVWQLASTNAILRCADAKVVADRLVASLPAQSVTLFVVPVQARPRHLRE